MLLRTRISLLVILSFTVVCVGFAFASLKREELIKMQYSSATIADRATLWQKIGNGLFLHMRDKAWIAANNEALLLAIYTHDHEAIQRVGIDISAQLRNQGFADRFDVLYADGSLAYSSQPGVFQSQIVAPGAAREIIKNSSRVRGIGNDKHRNIAIVLGIPLRAPPGLVGFGGVAVYATNIDKAIMEMEQATQSSVMIVNRRGRLLAGSQSELWESIKDLINLSDINALQTVEAEGRVYSAVVLLHEADLGNLVARLISVKDVTELARRQEQVSYLTTGAAIAFLSLVLVGLGYYMSRAFSPLTEGVGVLNALSHGDLQAQIEDTGSQDEVGRIARAVNVFRANLIAFDRFRRSRERQRRRQERFIRREMTQLADTLDEDERVAVLDELLQLEHLVRSAPGKEDEIISIADATNSASTALTRESDSLAMTALAFQKMSDRVQGQNQSLRVALAAKNAFIALQKELDIAARVQLSFLPDAMPPSEAINMTGTMKPAKDVGGDFYDFFRLDQHHIGVVVADVSGKGVPAALFMVMARTLMRSTARHVDKPGRVLADVNDLLEQNNDEQLFVTVFYGVLDERTGRFTYANGGHNPPVLANSQGVHPLKTTNGVALAMFDGLDYDDAYVDLEPGSRLILFSDGVTEAFDLNEEAFGDERLLNTARALPEQQEPDRDVMDIVAAVEEFAGEAPQFDDITCVVLRFIGPITEAKTSCYPLSPTPQSAQHEPGISIQGPNQQHEPGTSIQGPNQQHEPEPGTSIQGPNQQHEPETLRQEPDQQHEPGTSIQGPNQQHEPETLRQEPDQQHEPGTSIQGPNQQHEPETLRQGPNQQHEPGTSIQGPNQQHEPGTSIQGPNQWQTTMSTPSLKLVVKNDLRELARIADEIEAYGEAHDWPMKWILNINISLDELITNIVNYGYQDSDEHEIHVTLTAQDGVLVVVLEDDAIEFDPLSSAPAPHLTAEVEERPIGGLGVYFVKTLMDEVSYERRDGYNRLTLTQQTPK